MRLRTRLVARLLCACVALSGCTVFADNAEPTLPMTAGVLSGRQPSEAPAGATPQVARPDGAAESAPGTGPDRLTPERMPGTGSFIAPRQRVVRAQVLPRDGTIVLNFENAELSEVVRTVLGESLGANYTIDPRVQGTVSLETAQPIPMNALLETLETLLRMNGAALLRDEGIYRIVPIKEAIGGNVSPQLGESDIALPPGYAVQILPLRYVSAIHMEKILEPFLPPDGVLRVDIDRNLLVLAGTSRELSALSDTVRTFDVDWLAGMSVGLYPITFVDAETIAEELELALRSGEEGPLAGVLQFIPIKRLNALLVVTPQAAYLARVEEWIDRLDRGSAAGQNLYVYYLQYGKAADVAGILGEVFARAGAGAERRGELAPGLEPVRIATQRPAGDTSTEAPAAAPAPNAQQTAAAPQRPTTTRRSEELAFSGAEEIRIISDETNNSLLILATPQQYRLIEAAIRKIDIVPLQVLIEATIVEVTLNDAISLGLQWFFKSGNIEGRLSTAVDGAVNAAFPGFALVYNPLDAKVVLDALEEVTTIKVLSSPQLLVLDNQSAELQVGDEVPVATQQQQSPTDTTAPLVNTIQFRETGVILRVSPRVNAGGAVSIEVEQEVSNVSNAETLTPTISQRRVQSTISVQSGDTIVLGGLISEDSERTKSGLPFLSQIPILGLLFGRTSVAKDRTELLVLLTPTVIRSQGDSRAVTEEVSRKLNVLKSFDELLQKPRTSIDDLLP